MLSTVTAINAIEIAEKELKEKAIKAFKQFVDNYASESNKKEILGGAEHYLNVFKSLINTEK